MHEERLGTIIDDFLTGERLEATSYEQERQALAKFLVTQRAYPKTHLHPKLLLPVQIEESCHARLIDFLITDTFNRAIGIILFNPGDPHTFMRESLAAARLCTWPGNGEGSGVPLVLVTDAKKALLLATRDGKILADGAAAFARYDHLIQLAQDNADQDTTGSSWDMAKEARILAAYEQLCATCCQAASKPFGRMSLRPILVRGNEASFDERTKL